ncbi:DMT family transporter [Zhaonella formicivorans]|jgi:transporter family-2 protein|uniref:DMT family transporter n=1 Tax=Zhaonella formicivorans TaxID=2528593 RepID=UPI0010D1E02F|nr:DMT family transporter [Zhaonella formicivorans]
MSLTGSLFALIIAAVAGVTMALQGAMNSGLGKVIGLLQATLVVHLTATIAVLILIFGLRVGDGDFGKFAQVPWYYYLGGLLGVLITYGVVASMPKVGVANATAAIIVGQVSAAFIIDCLGMFGLEKVAFAWFKLVGLGLLAAGAKILLN